MGKKIMLLQVLMLEPIYTLWKIVSSFSLCLVSGRPLVGNLKVLEIGNRDINIHKSLTLSRFLFDHIIGMFFRN